MNNFPFCVIYCFACCCLQVVQQLLRAGADMTLCDCSQQTALDVCPPELQGKVLRWMSRPELPPQAQLLQAAWQGDLHSLQNLLVRLPHEGVEDFPHEKTQLGILLV